MIEDRVSVPMALCALVCLWSGPLAASNAEDAWAFAVERCLLPQQNVEPVDTTGLTALPGPVRGMAPDAVAWRGEDPGLVLAVAGEGAAVGAECRVAFEGPPVEVRAFSARFDDWAHRALTTGAYVLIERDPRHLESFEWREPVLRVQLLLADETGYAEFRAYEIDKEA
ncbi:MAG: hypothetical protein AAFY59_07970 [Pseudomonadota bacterium]